MIYLYQCEDCKTEQEKNHRLTEDNKEPCDRCGAPADKLKRLVNFTARGAHSSWSVK